MEREYRSEVGECLQLIADGWGMIVISAGITGGLFTLLHADAPVRIEQIAAARGYDVEKLEHWFYYAERAGLVTREADGYLLTSKGILFSPHSPAKELLAFAQLTEYFMSSAVGARDAFRKGHSLDSLSQGKVTRNYQPRVSDNLSSVMLENFQENDVQPGDTLLDIGSGTGTFLRSLAKRLPGVKITGSDSNLFAIEQARKENRNLGLTGQISMQVADMEADMADFGDLSYDWVTAINIIYYVSKENRIPLFDHLVRIARKGVFLTEGLLEPLAVMPPANVLMSLLWNDFSGWFRPEEAESFNRNIQKKYPRCRLRVSSVVDGAAYLLVLRKP